MPRRAPILTLTTLATLLVLSMAALGQSSTVVDAAAWRPDQLTEPFMRSLTKAQCMAKTVASLKAGCSSDGCLKSLGAITGDCVTWAKGDMESFCATYDRNYIARYCGSNDLDARRCLLIHIGKGTHCGSGASPVK
jgi:hypothetical protein